MMSDTEAAFSHKREMKGAIFCESFSLVVAKCRFEVECLVFCFCLHVSWFGVFQSCSQVYGACSNIPIIY